MRGSTDAEVRSVHQIHHELRLAVVRDVVARAAPEVVVGVVRIVAGYGEQRVVGIARERLVDRGDHVGRLVRRLVGEVVELDAPAVRTPASATSCDRRCRCGPSCPRYVASTAPSVRWRSVIACIEQPLRPPRTRTPACRSRTCVRVGSIASLTMISPCRSVRTCQPHAFMK